MEGNYSRFTSSHGIGKLAEIARNLWWTWNDDAKKYVLRPRSGALEETEQNPILFPGADEL